MKYEQIQRSSDAALSPCSSHHPVLEDKTYCCHSHHFYVKLCVDAILAQVSTQDVPCLIKAKYIEVKHLFHINQHINLEQETDTFHKLHKVQYQESRIHPDSGLRCIC